MAKVTWDDDGFRFFETGIDRGMLYLPFMPGMAWNGLVKVTETPIGGTPREFYIDGAKYLNLASLEEYSATIEAFTAPKAFALATGMTELSPGLLVGGQNRQQFAFSYRTLIGSDQSIPGSDYKIHIVYNALARNTDYVHQTSSENLEPQSRSWTVTAIPEEFVNGKPTAHYIVDTRVVDPDIIEHLESILYGSDIADPRLPSVAELIGILSSASIDIFMTMKKMIISGFGSVGSSELSIATGMLKMKKMRITASGLGISIGTAAPKMKKMKISGAGSTVPSPLETGAPDLLPYLITSGAAGTGATTLVMNVGDNNGWPVLTGDTIIACGGSGGAQPTGVADSRNSGYTKQAGTNGTPANSIWSQVANASGLQTAAGPRGVVDTVTATYSGTAQAKQWIVFGCRNLGAVDLAATPATGSSAAPTITSGTPAVANELVVVSVVHSNAGGTINTPAGWRLIAKNVTSGTNSLASVFVKTNRTTSPVTFTAALTTSTTWSVNLVTYRPTLTILRGIVGCSAFTGSYPGELSPNDNWHAQLRFRSVTGRTTMGIKRYCQEGDSAAASGNDLEGIIGTWAANGLKQVVSIKPRRAVGGGNSTGDTFIRNSLTWWRNNNLDLEIIIGNEADINGVHGPFGDGSTKNWDLSCPYTATSADEAAQNYLDYFTRYGRQVVAAGYPAMYNPAISSVAPTFSFMPPRLDTDGHYLLCGVYLDYYFTGDYWPSNNITMDDVISVCDGMDPKCPVGIGEIGLTDGTRRPKDDNPAGSLVASVDWMDTHVTPVMAGRPASNLRNLMTLWYQNGTANSLDTDTDIRIVDSFRRLFDACNPV